MKSKDIDFPNLLLQQFNFGEAEETTTAEESGDGDAERESEEE